MKLTVLLYFGLALFVCYVRSEEELTETQADIITPANVQNVGAEIENQAKAIGMKMIDFKKDFDNLEGEYLVKSDGFCQLKELLEVMNKTYTSQCPSELPKLLKDILEKLKALHKFLRHDTDRTDIQAELKAIEDVIADRKLNAKHQEIKDLTTQTFQLYKKIENLDMTEKLKGSEITNQLEDIKTKLTELLNDENVKKIFTIENDEINNCHAKSNIERKDFKQNVKDFKQNVKDLLVNTEQFTGIKNDLQKHLYDIYRCFGDISVVFGRLKYAVIEEHISQIENVLKDMQSDSNNKETNVKEKQQQLLTLLSNNTITDFRTNLGTCANENAISIIRSACDLYTRATKIMTESSDEVVTAMKNARTTEITVGNTASIVFTILEMLSSK